MGRAPTSVWGGGPGLALQPQPQLANPGIVRTSQVVCRGGEALAPGRGGLSLTNGERVDLRLDIPHRVVDCKRLGLIAQLVPAPVDPRRVDVKVDRLGRVVVLKAGDTMR